MVAGTRGAGGTVPVTVSGAAAAGTHRDRVTRARVVGKEALLLATLLRVDENPQAPEAVAGDAAGGDQLPKRLIQVGPHAPGLGLQLVEEHRSALLQHLQKGL